MSATNARDLPKKILGVFHFMELNSLNFILCSCCHLVPIDLLTQCEEDSHRSIPPVGTLLPFTAALPTRSVVHAWTRGLISGSGVNFANSIGKHIIRQFPWSIQTIHMFSKIIIKIRTATRIQTYCPCVV